MNSFDPSQIIPTGDGQGPAKMFTGSQSFSWDKAFAGTDQGGLTFVGGSRNLGGILKGLGIEKAKDIVLKSSLSESKAAQGDVVVIRIGKKDGTTLEFRTGSWQGGGTSYDILKNAHDTGKVWETLQREDMQAGVLQSETMNRSSSLGIYFGAEEEDVKVADVTITAGDLTTLLESGTGV